MALIQITPHLRELAPLEPGAFDGTTVAEVVDNLCLAHPALRSYVLEDQGRLRKHISIFVEGNQLRGAEALAHKVMPTTDIFIFQALSGG